MILFIFIIGFLLLLVDIIDYLLPLYCCSLLFLFLCCLLFLHNFSLSSNNHHGIWLSVITVQWNMVNLHTNLIFVAPTTKYKNCSTDLSVPTFSTAGFFHTSKIWFRENSTLLTYWRFLFQHDITSRSRRRSSWH